MAVEPGRHGRDSLATLLWGNSPQAKARASLRQALRHLHRTLGDLVEIDREAVGLKPGLPCDVTRFLESSDPEIALGLDTSRFLENFTPRHAPAFEEWAERTRDALMVRSRRLWAECGQVALARRDWRGALALGESWLAKDPFTPAAARLVIEARYLGGDPTGALDAWMRFARRYQQEVGAQPDGELAALVQRIESAGGREPGTEAVQETGPGPAVFEPGLVGRQREWDLLQAAWQEVEGGSGRVVVVEGEAGAGKSRLLDDFCRWVTARGGSQVRAGAWETGQATRYDTLLALVRPLVEHPGAAGADPISLGVVARLVPELRRRFPALHPHQGDPGTAVLEEAVADLFLAVAETRPLLVVVDDFQWCDAETTTVLHYLVRRLALAPVLWCVTITVGEATTDAPATRVVRALRALPGSARLRLEPLTVAEVWEVIIQLGPVAPEAAGRALAQRVHEASGGNPFYAVELVKSCVAEGWLVPHPTTGGWIVSEREDLPLRSEAVTATVQEAIARRLGRLPEELHLLLMTLAVHEHGLAADVLSHVHGMSRLRIASLGEALVHRHLASESEGRFRCHHPLTAQVIRESLGPVRRRELHRAIALALLEAARERGALAPPGEVAHHADLGGERLLAYEHALLASELARANGAGDEALHWLDLAARHAASADEVAIVDRATAELLEATGPVAPRRATARTGAATASGTTHPDHSPAA